MSERLLKLVEKTLIQLGDNAEAKLAVKAGVSVSLIYELKRGNTPLPKNIRKVALACGLSESASDELALERVREAKETA